MVIAGAPNVGKSTLMNAIAGRDVAITSPFAGTTRDPIEVAIDLRGYPVILVDTAGIRESADPIEQEGVRRARQRAENADLTLWLDDGGSAGAPPAATGATLVVRTKSDLDAQAARGSTGADQFAISAKTGEGVDALLEAIADRAIGSMASGEPAVLTLARHREAFLDARRALEPALASEPIEAELAAEAFRHAASAMDRVVGQSA